MQRAVTWFFDEVLPSIPSTGRQREPLRTANIIFMAKDDDSRTYVSHVRDAAKHMDYSSSTHVAVPFAVLRDILPLIPQYCEFGDMVFSSCMLPQGSGIGSPGSIIQAAYQRSAKFTDPSIPPAVLELISGPYVLQYVDDCLA